MERVLLSICDQEQYLGGICMVTLLLAFTLALLTAFGHSYLSERFFLQPMRQTQETRGVFSTARGQRLATAMFHLPSLAWAAMGLSLLVLDSAGGGYKETLLIYASVFAVSGLGNFWAVGRPHPGGVMLLATSGLILASL